MAGARSPGGGFAAPGRFRSGSSASAGNPTCGARPSSRSICPRGRPTRITVVFLSTPDCPACRGWEAAHRGRFLRSETGRAVRFVDVKGANLPSGVQPADWPSDLAALRAQAGAGRQPVPSFVIAFDERVILQQFGAGVWEPRVEPLLRHLATLRVEAEQRR